MSFLLVLWLAGSDLMRVENGIQPKETPWTLELEVELRLEEDDETFWAGGNQVVQVDDRGHMFILDQRDQRILEFGADGSFAAAHGRRGQAPGEFQGLVSFQILPDGRLLAFENLGGVSFLNIFKPGFVFEDRFQIGAGIPQAVRAAQFAPSGDRLFGLCTRVDPERQVEITENIIADREKGALTIRETLLYWETISFNPDKADQPDFWAEFLGQRMWVNAKGKNVYAAFDSKGNVYTAPADTYEVTGWNKDLTRTIIFSRKYKPIPHPQNEIYAYVDPIRASITTQLPPQTRDIITDNLIRRAIDIADFAPAKFPIAGLTMIDDETLMVIHEHNLVSGMGRGDLFTTDGIFRGSFTADNAALPSMIFVGDKAYAIETRDDLQSLVRYRFTLKKS